jgi:hypothetical protein
MRRIAVVGFVSAVLFVVAACSGGGSIGSACSGDSSCGNGFCNQLGVCTRDCGSHADCGCAPGTTNDDISNGKCGYACVNVGSGEVCARTCANDAQCDGQTTCQPATDSTGASLGYSECL